jgi:hypothetical protein
MGGTCGKERGYEKCIQILIGKSEEKRALGEPRLTWKDNIKIELKEIECDRVEWTRQAYDRVLLSVL